MNRPLAVALLAGLSLLAPPQLAPSLLTRLPAQQPAVDAAPAPVDRIIAAAVDGFRQDRGIPGVTCAVVLPDGRVIAVAAGLADVEAGRPMRATDRMMSGSVGKMLFATAILLAVEDGELDLDQDISRRLGDEVWFERLPNAAALTLRLLLRHRTGIPEHVQSPEFTADCAKDPDRVWQPADLLAYVLDREPLSAPDTAFSYADTNYIVAGMVYERATGRRIYDAVQARILDPLELSDTVPSDRRRIPGLVPGYGGEASPFGLTGKLIDEDGRFAINPQMEWTGGGFALTTADLARFARALFDGRILGADQLAAMVDAQPAPGLGRYGLGVIARPSPLGATLGHSGWFPGYLCQLTHYPDAGLTVALQVNTDDVRKVGPLRRAVDAIAAAVRDALANSGAPAVKRR